LIGHFCRAPSLDLSERARKPAAPKESLRGP
jgi:hypothetical protein